MSTHGCTCWEPGAVDDPDCPRHGITARLGAVIDAADDVIRLTSPQPLFKGIVSDAGGGVVDILIDRDTDQYPNIGAKVIVYADTQAAAVDDEVDRLSDAAADRADGMVDRYDPDDRQPMAGDPYWSEEPTWD